MRTFNYLQILVLAALVSGCGDHSVKVSPPKKTKSVSNPTPVKTQKGGVEKPSPQKVKADGKEAAKPVAQKKPDSPPRKKKPKKNQYPKPIKVDLKNINALVVKSLAKDGVHLDRKKRLVWVEGEIKVVNQNLEFLVVGPKGKKHESLLMVDCRPSSLNAAMICLGLKKGKNYDMKERIPRPSRADVESGRIKPYVVVHPEGPGLYLTVEWQDKKGKTVRRRVEDLVMNLKTKKPLKPRTWIYFGGRMAALYKGEEPVYVADYDQNIVSVCYMYPNNHLFTIKHKNGMSQSNWWPNLRLVPAKGTPIKLFFSLEPLK